MLRVSAPNWCHPEGPERWNYWMRSALGGVAIPPKPFQGVSPRTDQTDDANCVSLEDSTAAAWKCFSFFPRRRPRLDNSYNRATLSRGAQIARTVYAIGSIADETEGAVLVGFATPAEHPRRIRNVVRRAAFQVRSCKACSLTSQRANSSRAPQLNSPVRTNR